MQRTKTLVATTADKGDRTETPTVDLSARRLARNVLLNLVGQGLPLLVAVATIPYVVHGLGPERFGLLSLAWVILGYFTVFDLGLGRATTKYVAELIGRGEQERIPEVIWTAVACQLAFGIVGGTLLFAASPLLVEQVLRVPAELAGEADQTLKAISLGVPVVLVSSSLSGALEARQRFDLVNLARVLGSIGTYLLPVLGVAAGAHLVTIALLIVLWRVLTAALLIWLNSRPSFKVYAMMPSVRLLRPLLGFGSWVMVSSVVGPILVYLDRFLLGALVSVAAVGYYVAPYEAVTRLWLLPGSLVMVLFPTFSTLAARRESEVLGTLLLRSVRLIGASLTPPVLVIAVLAPAILRLWLGPEFAAQSAGALRVLATGVLVNSVAHAPYALLQAMGRPDLTAKFHLLELPVYLIAAFSLVGSFGVSGAAWAWTLRVCLDTALLVSAVVRLIRPQDWARTVKAAAATSCALLTLGVVTARWAGAPGSQHAGLSVAALAGLLLLFSGLFVWRVLLDEQDRALLRAVVG